LLAMSELRAEMVRAHTRIDAQDTQIKVLFKDVDKIEDEILKMTKTVTRASTITTLLSPLLTAAAVYLLTK
jgi:hypothetical protein